MFVSGDIVAPLKIYAPQPQYTEEARRARVQGTVIVQAIIDCRGFVTEVNVLQGLPLGLSEATVSAVSQWRFTPATLNGMPISVYYNLAVNFRLQ
jgi:protein TonB